MKANALRKRRTSSCRGEISVFLALLSVLFLSFFLSLMDGAWVQFSKSSARRFSLQAVHSVFGEYQTELLEDYGIFALDSGYRSGMLSEASVLTHYRDFLSYHTNMEKGLTALSASVNWRLSLASSDITAMELLTDRGGAPMREQISDAMQTTLGVEAVQQLLDTEENVDEIRQMETTWETESEESSAALEDANRQYQDSLQDEAADTTENTDGENTAEEAAGSESAASIEEALSDEDNPIADADSLRQTSILHTVLENAEDVSTNALATEVLVSHRERKSGYGNCSWQKERNALMDTVLFREYLLNRLSSYQSQSAEGGALAYEAEYVAFGKGSDIENLEAFATRLLLLREAINFAYLCTDSAKMAQAAALAATTAGLLALPALTEVFKWGFLLAWAYGESVLDVRTIFAGGKVPLFKDSSSWEIGLLELPSLLSGFRTRRDQSQGIGYTDMLRVLMYLGNQETQTYRLLDLAEANIRSGEESPAFYADACVVGLRIQNTWSTTHNITYTFPVEYAYQ